MQVMDYHEAVFASDLTAPQKIVALAISKHYNWKNHRVAFPSNRTLVSETSLALSTIVKAKKVLVERGFITSKQRFNNSSEYGCTIPEQLVWSQIESNNEFNNELNNEKDKDSNESFVSINNIHQEDVGTTFEVFKESTAPAAAMTKEQADWLMSW
jgi:DNA-binding transcriptional MocR family regulator